MSVGANRLVIVDGPRQAAASHQSFVRGLRRARDRAIDLARRTRFWVYEPDSRTFSPSKFTGYVAMDFERYDAAYEGQRTGAKFDGGITHQALARILGAYQVDAGLSKELERWIASQLGPDALDGIDRSKWRFARLPVAVGGGLASLAGGWEGSEELVAAIDEGRRTSRRGAPDLDS